MAFGKATWFFKYLLLSLFSLPIATILLFFWYNLSYPPPSTSSAFCYLSRSSTWPVAVIIPIQTMGKFQRSFMDSTSVVRDLGSPIRVRRWLRFTCPDTTMEINAFLLLIIEALLWVIIWICTCGGKRSSKAVAKIGLVAVN
ncbi:hypothetical protein V8C40DRAFT_174652 [Trichoderma camerunense]